MSNSNLAGLILAAGKGTRMMSDLPKGLHEVAGVPMVQLVGDAVLKSGVSSPIVVVGYHGDLVKESLGSNYRYAVQEQQLGTGHATMMAADFLKDHHGPVLVTPGDTPLLSADTLAQLFSDFEKESAQVSMATFVTVEPKGYGRILRDQSGFVRGIVEDKDATEEEKNILEVNPAVYVFDCQLLLEVLPEIKCANSQNEYYLTDAVSAISKRGGKVVARVFDDPDEFMGVNDRWQLAEASRIMRLRILREHAMRGVTIVDPTSTYIGFDVQIEPDVTIQPMTVIEGKTKIGSGSAIGPNAWIKDSIIEQGCRVFMSHIDQAHMSRDSRCGPFSNLRPGANLGTSVKIGNFVEIKNTDIGDQTAVSHLTYLGDASIGKKANIGAGTITCNYDGFSKHRTEIGDNSFVGSNSTLVAPIKIGNETMVAAGSVVTHDVPDDAIAIGRARQENKEGWVALWRKKKSNQA